MNITVVTDAETMKRRSAVAAPMGVPFGRTRWRRQDSRFKGAKEKRAKTGGASLAKRVQETQVLAREDEELNVSVA